MLKKLVAVFVVFVCVNTCFALDITTRSGTAYRHCEVVKVEPDGIRISHADGAAKISFEELPDALQRQYGYDAAKAAAYRKTAADAKSAAEAKAAIARQLAEETRQKEAANVLAAKQKEIALRREQAEATERERIKKEDQAKERSKRQAEAAIHSGLVILVVGFFIYFIPSAVGILRGKSNWFAIVVLNLFLGWTFVGWVVALVWACAKDQESAKQTVIVHLPSQPYGVQHPTAKEVAGRVVEPRRLPPKT